MKRRICATEGCHNIADDDRDDCLICSGYVAPDMALPKFYIHGEAGPEVDLSRLQDGQLHVVTITIEGRPHP